MREAVDIFLWLASGVLDILIDASFYLFIGLLLAGVAKAMVPSDFIARHIGRPTTSSILKASMIGVPMPLCSCSVLPMAVSLREKGASKAATTSFLISAPETGVDSIAVSYAMLDPLMTFFRPLAAFLTAFFAGILENWSGRSDGGHAEPGIAHECCDKTSLKARPAQTSVTQKLLVGIRYSFGQMLPDIAYYLLIGLIISGVIASAVPPDFFMGHQIPYFLILVSMLVVGVPVYVCASASTPIAAALILKGLSPGAALVFLLAGPATNLSSIGIVKKMLGGRSVALYLTAIAVTALVCGLVLDLIYSSMELPIKMNLGEASEIIPLPVKVASAVIMLPLLVWGFLKELRSKLSHKSI